MNSNTFPQCSFFPASNVKKLVCIGDSNTAFMEQWIPQCEDAKNWTVLISQQFGLNVINAGVGTGNTSAQMLARFQTDVIDLSPDYCIIEQGANDTLNGFTIAQTMSNISQMVQLCQKNNIIPMVMCCSPQFQSEFWYSYYGHANPMRWEEYLPAVRYAEKQYCQQNGIAYLDIYTPQLKSATEQNLDLYAFDKVHPNSNGYRKTAEVVVSVLQNLL